MSNLLFLASPSHGHVNPTVGLVAELVRRGERVTYFASEAFRERIEATGATGRDPQARRRGDHARRHEQNQ